LGFSFLPLCGPNKKAILNEEYCRNIFPDDPCKIKYLNAPFSDDLALGTIRLMITFKSSFCIQNSTLYNCFQKSSDSVISFDHLKEQESNILAAYIPIVLNNLIRKIQQFDIKSLTKAFPFMQQLIHVLNIMNTESIKQGDKNILPRYLCMHFNFKNVHTILLHSWIYVIERVRRSSVVGDDELPWNLLGLLCPWPLFGFISKSVCLSDQITTEDKALIEMGLEKLFALLSPLSTNSFP
jgi:hypothetical protein